jgi:hypothetical protein
MPSGSACRAHLQSACLLQRHGSERSMAFSPCSIHAHGEAGARARRARCASGARAPWLAMRYLPSFWVISKRSSALMLRVVAKGETRSACAYGAYMGTMTSASGRTYGRPRQARASEDKLGAVGAGVRLPPTQAAATHCTPSARHGRAGTYALASRACRHAG